ncbi:MAG: hypothetical protein Q9208_003619 [Pyrenodesmia sp. 3 TL-2023]
MQLLSHLLLLLLTNLHPLLTQALPAFPSLPNNIPTREQGGLALPPTLRAPPGPLPYRYRISLLRPYSILFETLGAPIDRHATDILLYRFITRLNRIVRDDPLHSLAPINGIHSLDEGGALELTIFAPHPDFLTASWLATYLGGLGRFLREFGYVSCGFALEYEIDEDMGGGFGRAGGGSLG